MGLVRAVVVFVDHLFVPRRERDEIGVRVSAVVVAAPKQKQWLRRNPVLFVCPKVRSVMLHPKLSRMLINSTQGKRSLVMSSPQHNKLSNICGNGFSSRSVLSLHLESVHNEPGLDLPVAGKKNKKKKSKYRNWWKCGTQGFD